MRKGSGALFFLEARVVAGDANGAHSFQPRFAQVGSKTLVICEDITFGPTVANINSEEKLR
jgi:hypothetical protein